MKKLLLMLLGVLMTLPMMARDFEYTYEGQTLTYTVISEDDKTCMTRAGGKWSPGNSVEGDLVIPAVAIDGDMEYKVTEIGEFAFIYCSSLSTITIPESVTKISDQAFYVCTGLTAITIPSSVTEIGRDAFCACTSLSTITIPESVIEIGERALACCNDLQQIQVNENNPNYSSADGVLFDKNRTILIQCPAGREGDYIVPGTVTKIGESALYNCSGLTTITIPGTVTIIENNAFYNCSRLSTITIPNSVTKIGDYAFFGCGALDIITIPESVTEIGKNALNSCGNLKKILVESGNPNYSSVDGVLFDKNQTILIQCPAGKEGDYFMPGSVTKIGDYAFQDCRGLAAITIPDSVTEIGDYAFVRCGNLSTITIPNSVTNIGDYAFYGCSGLTTITIPDSVIEIGEWAFCECSGLATITIPDSVTEIGAEAFLMCSSLTTITIPNSITTIKMWTFLGCTSLTAITIPDSVTEIGQSAFEGCSSLVSITIPGSVNNIVWGAFLGCSSLTSVYYGAAEPIEADYGVFGEEVYENATLYVPAVAVDKCRLIDPWKNFKSIEVDGLSGIEEVSTGDAPCEVYTTSGVKVGDSTDGLVPGIYVVRQGNAVKKIAVN